jgi:aspartyl-tRNA synthetase
MQHTLRARHKVIAAIRRQLDDSGFTEIETPILTKSTPEGARDFLVPSRVQKGTFYALPQSPQIYKQLCMLSGMDRYYQLARCFRDEDNRADRQPEFTQLDLEMSFVSETDVQNQIEGIWKRVLKDVFDIEQNFPLPRVTWDEAMNRYGSDKPDRRFAMELCDIADLAKDCGFSVFEGARDVRGINAKGLAGRLSRKEIDSLGEYVKTFRAKGLAWAVVEEGGVRSPIAKFMAEGRMEQIAGRMDGAPGDVLFFIADRKAVVLQALGNLRCEIARRLDLIDRAKLDLFWVTEFPMFEWNEETERFDAMHHPFTASMPEDEAKIEAGDLGSVRARAYDLVLNGIEMGSGSIRIHDSGIQARTFRLLGLEQEEIDHRFGFLLEAFQYGVPPHGGFAFGIDRMMMLLLGKESLRDVLAFPKAQNGSCLMMDTPSDVSDEQLKALGLGTATESE